MNGCLIPDPNIPAYELELELELIQTRMTQKPLLWVEVGARAVRERSKTCVWRAGQCECRVAPVFGVRCVEPDSALWCHQLSLCGAPSRGMCEAPLMLGR